MEDMSGERSQERPALPTELVDIRWVARRLGVIERHVRRLVQEKRVPLHQVGGHLLRFDPAEIEHGSTAGVGRRRSRGLGTVAAGVGSSSEWAYPACSGQRSTRYAGSSTSGSGRVELLIRMKNARSSLLVLAQTAVPSSMASRKLWTLT